MTVTHRGLALLVLAACSAPATTAPGTNGGRVFGGEVATLGEAGPAPPPAGAGLDGREVADAGLSDATGPGSGDVEPVPAATAVPGDARARELALRDMLAAAEDPVPPALELAELLQEGQRHAAALAVVETALRRAPEDARLGRVRAALLRDLARRDEALSALRRWDRAHPDADPTVLLEIAELEWLSGRRQAAAKALAELERRFSRHPWFESRRPHLQTLARELAEAERPRSVSVRDLLADLRGAPLPSMRLRALHALQKASGEIRRRALMVALADPSGPVRAVAVELAALPADELEAVCRAALADADWQVRTAAARRATELPLRTACALLVEAVGRENEPVAFLAVHEGLLAVSGQDVALPTGGSARADVRARVAETWRRWWQQ